MSFFPYKNISKIRLLKKTDKSTTPKNNKDTSYLYLKLSYLFLLESQIKKKTNEDYQDT